MLFMKYVVVPVHRLLYFYFFSNMSAAKTFEKQYRIYSNIPYSILYCTWLDDNHHFIRRIPCRHHTYQSTHIEVFTPLCSVLFFRKYINDFSNVLFSKSFLI